MNTAGEVVAVVITAVTFVVRFGVAVYRARVDGLAAEMYQRRHDAELLARGWPVE